MAVITTAVALQAAINAANWSSPVTLECDYSVIFEGTFTLPVSGGTRPNTTTFHRITTSATSGKPLAGMRTGPGYAAIYPRFRATQSSGHGGEQAFKTAPGAVGWQIDNVEVTQSWDGTGTMMELGRNDSAVQSLKAHQPQYCKADQVYFNATRHPIRGAQRGVDTHGRYLTVTNCYFHDIGTPTNTQDSAIGWSNNGQGPITYYNNFCGGGTYGIFTGGAGTPICSIATCSAATTTTATVTITNGGEPPVAGQIIAGKVSSLLNRSHTTLLTSTFVSGTTYDLTFTADPETPSLPAFDTGAGSNVQWGVTPVDISITHNHFKKPLAWRDNAILATPTIGVVTAGSGGSLTAGNYNVTVIARGAGYQGAMMASNRATVIAVTVGASGSISVNWSAVTNATTYRVCVQRPSDSLWHYVDIAGTSTTYTTTGTALGGTPAVTGSKWAIKNATEFKCGINITLQDNVIENIWSGIGGGYALWVKSVNQPSAHLTPWQWTYNVNISYNRLIGIDGFLLVSGCEHEAVGSDRQVHRPKLMELVLVEHNLVEDSGIVPWRQGSQIYAITLQNGTKDLTIRHNTVQHTGTGTIALGASVSRNAYFLNLSIHSNLFLYGTYGVKGQDTPSVGSGKTAIAAHASADGLGPYTFTKNGFYRNVASDNGWGSTDYTTPGNYAYTQAAFEALFVDYLGHNFALSTTSAAKGAGVSGSDLGADIATLLTRTATTVSGDPSGDPVPLPTDPVITTLSPLPLAQVGVAYSQVFAVAAGTPTNWAVSSGALPAGLALNAATGILSGTPTTATAADLFDVTVTDISGAIGTKSFALTVGAAAVVGGTIQARLEMRLAPALRQQLIAGRAAAVWPFSDPWGQQAHEAVNLLHGDNVNTVPVSGMLPEYGGATQFTGNAYSRVPHDVALEPSTSVALATLLRLDAAPTGAVILARKENGGDTDGLIEFGISPGSSTAYRDRIVADSPSFYWRLAENSGTAAAPTVGATSGTHTSGPLVGQAGLISDTTSGAVKYDGTNDYTTFGDIGDFTGTASMTVEMFVKVVALPAAGAFARIISKEITDGNGTQGWWFGIDSAGKLLISRRLNSVSQEALASTALTVGTVYHIAATYDGTTARVYKDGVLVASVASNHSIINHTNPLTLGTRSLISNFFSGYIAELAIYPTALSAATLAAHSALRTAVATSTELYFGVVAGGTYQSARYAIPSMTAWVAAPRYLVARYTGAAIDITQIAMDGTVTTLVTKAVTGALASTSPSELYFGASEGSSQFASATMQMAGLWVDDYPTDAEIADFAEAMVWTDVTEDLVSMEVEWGIRESGPLARIATTGTLQFVLRNDDRNSGGKEGFYSPDHQNKRAGFDLNSMVRYIVTDPATPDAPYIKWVGALVEATPMPGRKGPRTTSCLAVDFFDDLARATNPPIPLSQNIMPGDVVRKVVEAAVVHPHVMDVSDGNVPIVYGGDTSQDEREVLLGELAKLNDTELGYLYQRGSQAGGASPKLVFEGVDVRQFPVAPRYVIDNEMTGLEVSRSRSDIVTRVQNTVYPRQVDASDVVIYSLEEGNLSPIAAGETIQLRTPYTDPSSSGARIGALDVIPPVATTDYQAEDSVGANLTSSLAVSFVEEPGANSAIVTLTNNAVVAMTVTKFQLRGKGIYTFQPAVMEQADPVLQRKYGDMVLTMDQPYQHDPSQGAAAAAFLLAAWKREATVPSSLRMRVGNGSPTNLVTACIAGDVGEAVSVSEQVTGMDTTPYFINGVRHTLRPGGQLDVEWFLQRKEITSVWILGRAGATELGSTTRLGY